jgi:hypothetical protein
VAVRLGERLRLRDDLLGHLGLAEVRELRHEIGHLSLPAHLFHRLGDRRGSGMNLGVDSIGELLGDLLGLGLGLEALGAVETVETVEAVQPVELVAVIVAVLAALVPAEPLGE